MLVDKKICLEKRKVTLANESCERRAARLEYMRKRLEAETPEQRVARLEQMSTLQKQRLEIETPEQRAARLEQLPTRLNLLQQTKSAQSNISKKMCAPQIDQGYVKDKMNRFHTEMLSIESPLCTTCLEKFPGTKMSVKSPECLRCYRDNKVPKFYSANNYMSPGFVPVELQDSLYRQTTHYFEDLRFSIIKLWRYFSNHFHLTDFSFY